MKVIVHDCLIVWLIITCRNSDYSAWFSSLQWDRESHGEESLGNFRLLLEGQMWGEITFWLMKYLKQSGKITTECLVWTNFFRLCDKLRPIIQREETCIWSPVDVPKHEAFDPVISMYQIKNVWGKQPMLKVLSILMVKRVSNAISRYLWPMYIKLPLTEDKV